MSGDSKIEWTDRVWNPVTGCTKVSKGCRNCYAERMSKRLAGRYGYPADDPFKVTLHPDRLDEPLRWRKPKRVFVCSMGDLFHEDVPDEFIAKAFHTMGAASQHTFLVLTKRPERMKKWFSRVGEWEGWYTHDGTPVAKAYDGTGVIVSSGVWPHPNVHLGVSVEDQATADERIPLLLQIPAAKRFVSYEPAIGPVDLTDYFFISDCHCNERICDDCLCLPSRGLNGVIMGGESGPGARPMHPDWARKVRDQCKAANVPFFFKQWGQWAPFYDRDIDDPDWRDVPKESPKICRLNLEGGCGFHGERVIYFKKVSKKAAGAMLDGEEHKDVPA